MWYIIIAVMLAVSLFVAYRMTLSVDRRLDRIEREQMLKSQKAEQDSEETDSQS